VFVSLTRARVPACGFAIAPSRGVSTTTDRPTDRPGRSFGFVGTRATERERRRAMTATDPTRVAGEIEGLTIKSMAKDAVRGFVSFVARRRRTTTTMTRANGMSRLKFLD